MNKDPFQVPLIQCCAVTKIFKEKAQHTVVLRDINFTLYPKERVAIVGTSGSGKSTLLHLLSCLDHVTTGDIRILEHPVTQYSPQQLNHIRNQYLGFVYQFHHLLPEFSLFENIALPLLIQKKPKQLIQEIVHDMLKKLGLTHRAHHRPSEISGGERQRVAIGRAIITQPRLILADEPTGNLDNHTAHQIIDLLCSIEEAGIIIVTHDMSIAKCMNKILRLENGHLVPEVMPEWD